MCYTRGMRKVLLLSLLGLAIAAPAAAQFTTTSASGTVTVNGVTSTYSATIHSYSTGGGSGAGIKVSIGPPFKHLLPFIPRPLQGDIIYGQYIPTYREILDASRLRAEMMSWVWPTPRAAKKLIKLRAVRHQIAPAAAPSGF
jgi:hypothetical protein